MAMFNDDSLPSWLVFLAFVGGLYLMKLIWTLLSIILPVFLIKIPSLFKKGSSDTKTHDHSPVSNAAERSSGISASGYETAFDHTSDPETSSPVSTDTSNPSSSVAGSDYEVFLSFRGPDTRKGFTNHLYTNLDEAGISVFLDNEELRVGEEIGENLVKAINESKICVPIFSKDYASSKWCLKEVAHMVKCRNTRNQLVLPIYYDVTPHQVRHQSGTYEKAFKQHSKRYDKKTIQEWRNALAEVGGLKGWDLKNDTDGHEGRLVRLVVSRIRRELKKARLIVNNSLVGMEESLDEVMELLQVGANDVRIIGIHGIGGIGKTTLAMKIYNKLLKHFEHSSFLKDIRETSLRHKGLEKLQTQLVSDILKYPENEIVDVIEGTKVLNERLRNKKVLILLDAVDKRDQINALAADLSWFAEGSRILITTRNKDVLDVPQVRGTYEVRPLPSKEALLLFCKHAFTRDSPPDNYADLSTKIVETTGGLPLALEVIGSYLSQADRPVWEESVEKLQKMLNKDVKDKLRISYDALDSNEKQIFLDIACFFIGTDKEIASYMWKDCGLFPKAAVEVLLAMSLIKVGDDNVFWMHDQLRDLGRGIVRDENEMDPSKRSRLWSSEDAMHVLNYHERTRKVEAIHLDYGIGLMDICFTREQFMNLPSLRFLRLNKATIDSRTENIKVNIAQDMWCVLHQLRWLQWHYCPIELMTTSLNLENLVILDLSKSNVTDDWRGWNSEQLANKLKVLILESCQSLRKTPNFSNFQMLERLSLRDCRCLHYVHPSIGELRNLIFLSLENCSSLSDLPQVLSNLEALTELRLDGSSVQELPTLEGLKKLEILSAKKCMSLSHIPPTIEKLTSLLELSLDKSGVRTLPISIGALVKLRCLSLRECKLLKKLPDSIGGLTSLVELYLSGTGLLTLPDSVGKLNNLQELLVDGTKITNLPSLCMLEKLKVIDASDCKSLRGEILPELGTLCSLMTLKMDRTNITVLPMSITSLSYLQTLDLTDCNALQALPVLPSSLRSLSITCTSMEAFPDLSNYTNLLELRLFDCYKLKTIPNLGSLGFLKILILSGCNELAELEGLEKLKSLRELSISWCDSLEKLSDLPKSKQLKTLKMDSCISLQSLANLSALKKLRHLSLMQCKKLCVVEGLGELESLEHLNMKGCDAIENLPNFSKLRQLKELVLAGCKKLKKLQGLEELESLKRVDIEYSPYLGYYTEKWPHIPWSGSVDPSSYEAFLTFKNEDVGDRLYNDLMSADIRVFKDRGELHEGEEIYNYVLKVMNQSKIFIPIICKGCASSLQCLQKMSHMVECSKERNQLVLPVFYNVTPYQVQGQSGTYEEAFNQHMRFCDANMVEGWRAALREVGAMKGWQLLREYVLDDWKAALRSLGAMKGMQLQLEYVIEDCRAALIEVGPMKGLQLQLEHERILARIVSDVREKLGKSFLVTSEHLVGIEDHVEEVMKLLEIDASDVRIVEIHGIAGIGKTTLAKVIYNKISKCFECRSFLPDIRERSELYRGLANLQNQLLSDILIFENEEKFEFSSCDEALNVVSQKIQGKKVLIFLDDVDQRHQLDALIPNKDLLPPGSRILITTREKNVLNSSPVEGTYELNEMHFGDAVVLFSKHAFRRNIPPLDFINLSKEIVSTTRGLPLALGAIGSLLNKIDKTEWSDLWRRLGGMPHENVQNKLRESYNGLCHEEKQIYLDIACFFIGTDMRIAVHMWENCKFFPKDALEKLLSLSLVKCGHNNTLWMENQPIDLGKEIVREESLQEPGKRSRLWSRAEARHVLESQKGTEKIEAICLDYGTESEDYCFRSEQFRSLSNLRFLRLNKANIAGDFNLLLSNLRWLHWRNCPVELMATNLYLKELVILELSEGNITHDWNGWSYMQMASKLKVLILESCWNLAKSPAFSQFPMLEILKLDNCTSLDFLDPSVGSLKNLTSLSVKGCSSLKVLPQSLTSLEELTELCIDGTCVEEIPNVKGLQVLSAGKCESLSQIPDSIGHLTWLSELVLDASGVCKLPESVGALSQLRCLSLKSCKSLRTLPSSIGQLNSLKELDLSHTCIDTLPDSIGKVTKLEVLRMIKSKIKYLPSTLGMLEKLQVINFSGCRDLNGEIFVDPIKLHSLRTLILDGTNITTLPASISGLLHLQTLDLMRCYKLHTIPELPNSLQRLLITCIPIDTLPHLSNLVNLEELQLVRCDNLVEVSIDFRKLSKLKRLILSHTKISALPAGIGLSQLEKLAIEDCVELECIPGLPNSLCEIRVKGFLAQNLPDLSNATQLSVLQLSRCHKVKNIPGLGSLVFLTTLSIIECGELVELDGLEKLPYLRILRISECELLENLPGLSRLKLLQYLITEQCKSLQSLPDLSGLVMLKYLDVSCCENLQKLDGLEKLESLQTLNISECKELDNLPNLSKLLELRDLNVQGCEKLREIEGLERLESEVSVYTFGCTSLQSLTYLPNIKIQRQKSYFPCSMDVPDTFSEEMI